MAQESSPQPQPQQRNTRKRGLIIGIIVGVIVVTLATFMLFIVIKSLPFIGIIGKSFQINSNYSDRVTAMQAEAGKTAGIGESLKAGPFSIKLQNVTPNYQPTQQQQDYIDNLRNKDTRTRDNSMRERYAKQYAWNDNNARYVLVHTEVSYDAEGVEKGTVYPTFADSAVDILSSATIGDATPVITWVGDAPDAGRRFLSAEGISAVKSAEPVVVTYLFRMNAQAPINKLSYTAMIFSAVSNIVGTEGMPRQEFTYTFTLQ